MSIKQKRQLLWLAILATLVWSLMMFGEALGYHKDKKCNDLPTAHGVTACGANVVGALAISTSAADFQRLIEECHSDDNRLWNIHVVQANTCMDFLFIAFYGSVFWLFAEVLGGKFGIWVKISITVTMLMDVGENVYLLWSLHTLQALDPGAIYPPSVSHPPGTFSLLKWVFFALSLFLLAGCSPAQPA